MYVCQCVRVYMCVCVCVCVCLCVCVCEDEDGILFQEIIDEDLPDLPVDPVTEDNSSMSIDIQLPMAFTEVCVVHVCVSL